MLTNSDIFLITNDNYKSQEEKTYGYKWFGNEGFFIDVKWKNDRLKISRSYMSPYIVYYSSGSFYCISNSIKTLSQYLINNRGIKLTEKTKQDKIWIKEESYETDFEELRLVPITVDIYIGETGLQFKENKKYFRKPFNTETIDDWFNTYKHLLTKISPYTTIDLSGGQDTRILYSMVNKKRINKVHGLKCDKFKPELIITKNLSTADNIILNEPRSEMFSYCISDDDTSVFSDFSPMDMFNSNVSKRIERNNIGNMYYHVWGMGTECLKLYKSLNTIKIPLSWGLRYQSLNLISYYNYGIMNIFPFMDSRLLSLKCTKDQSPIDYIYKNLIDKKYLNFPFYNSNEQYYYTYHNFTDLLSKSEIENINPKPSYYINNIDEYIHQKYQK
jgi:hypothetical protein